MQTKISVNFTTDIKTVTDETGTIVVVDTDRLQLITFYGQFDMSFYHIYINKLTSDTDVIQFTYFMKFKLFGYFSSIDQGWGTDNYSQTPS